MGLFNTIRSVYGEEIRGRVLALEKLHKSLASIRNRMIFLLECRRQRIIPSHIQGNFKCLQSLYATNHPFNNKIHNIQLRFANSTLNLEIHITVWSVKNIERQIADMSATLSENMDHHHWNSLTNTINKSYSYRFVNIKNRNRRKLHNLVQRNNNLNNLTTNKNSILNLTNYTLPDAVTNFLQFSPSCAINNFSSVSFLQLIKDLEYAIVCKGLGDQANRARAQCTNILMNYKHKTRPISYKYTHAQLLRQFRITKLFLKQNPQLLVTHSDKGKLTVILTRQQYDSKMLELLNDTVTYKTIQKDPTPQIINKVNNLVKEWVDCGIIAPTLANKYKSSNANISRIYGLVKAHKANHPVRPIISYVGSPFYAMSRLLVDLLKHAVPTKYSIKNSFEFVEKIKDVTIPSGHVLVSFDVTSMYTNITMPLIVKSFSTLNIVPPSSYLFSDAIYKTEILNVLNLIMQSNCFKYNNSFYSQIQGLAMGSPISPTIASIAMHFVIEAAITQLDFCPPFLYIYADDILTLLPSDKIQSTLNIFNSIDKKIKFTMEEEQNSQIPFLDVLVIRLNDNLRTKWYKKPYSSNRILHYGSCHSRSQILASALSLKHRIFTLSHPSYHNTNANTIRDILNKNGYPNNIINRILTNTPRNATSSFTSNEPPTNDLTQYFKFPYVDGLSDRIRYVLKKYNIRLAYYPPTKISHIYSHLKPKCSVTDMSGVVYKIPCMDCDLHYIGTTKNKLVSRLKQHANDCRLVNALRPNKTALSQHHFQFGHSFDFDSVTVLDIEPIHRKRYISEALHIKHSTHSINFQTDTQQLSQIYSGLLR